MRKYNVGQRLTTTAALRDKYDVSSRTPCKVVEYDSVLNWYKIRIFSDEAFAPETVAVTAEMMEVYFDVEIDRVTVPATLVGWYKNVERYLR